ncbi:methylated-DNA--[protein]-cysteine S-methyltransferase [Thermomicrobium sp.]
MRTIIEREAMGERERVIVVTTRLLTPIGHLDVYGWERGLVAVVLPGQDHARVRARLAARLSGDRAQAIRFVADAAALRAVREQLEEYFAGTRRDFALELDPLGTPFQLHIWRLVTTIPYGTTVTYSALAQRLGCPRAVRAVGAAVAANPLPIVIPCHRVVGRDGRLTGFAGGLHCKAWLLEHERLHA